MKRIFLTILGVAFLAAPALRAQGLEGIGLTVEKVYPDKLRAAIARSDAEIANPKKNTKAATWIKRGEAFIDADAKPVNSLFAGLDESTLKLTFGEVAPVTEQVGDAEYLVYTYEHFKAYVKGGKVEYYVPVTVIAPNALDKAYEAFAKAYEIDARTERKVNTGMINIRNKSVEYGGTLYAFKDYKAAADNFRRAYRASIHPALNQTDTLSLFYAGFLGTIAGDYQTALADLNKAIELGYGADGEAYYYKFHCQYNLGDQKGALETLKHAVTLYPNNESILEGLMTLYAAGDEDPSELIPVVLNAIDQNPTNPGLYQGLARVYDKLGRLDDAVEAARKAVELAPDDFYANYFYGLFIIKKADKMDVDLRYMTITSPSQLQEAQAVVDKVYAQAIAPLEKAFSINNTEIATVELLRNLTRRLNEMPGMQEKFERYDTIYKEMEQ